MKISKLTIKNFKIFSPDDEFVIDDLNVPDGVNEGTGLNVFVGENGSGKTSLLEAIALPLLEYKAENFSIENFNDFEEKVEINIFSKDNFTVDGTMPRSSFEAKGFSFEAGVRARDSKNYLSSIIVSDQKFIKSDPSKPKDGSPDLRSAVNNPFKGKRFNENDVLFLDKNRLFQTRSGNFNTTRFDRLMEDFSYQYLKNNEITDLNEELGKKIRKEVENDFLDQAVSKFREICDHEVRLDFLDNLKPFKESFFSIKKDNEQQILINNLGSGYEMIFCLLYSFYLAKQTGKELIILIDEPELHLHPALQEKFIQFLIEFSKEAQIFITSHSPLVVKQVLLNEKVKVRMLKNGSEVLDIGNRLLSYLSANEINYLAFDLPTEEYHNELFEELKIKDDGARATPLNLKDFDIYFFQTSKGEPANYPYNGASNQVSIHTHLRTQIHHRGTAGQPNITDIKKSIETMRTFF
ncbi:MAG TPA: AAA family ATPase [Candidatus Paceibacterota bacterium]|jgi:predicted ATP-dependent endonuclease of OLD family|nr:AAA family ATPase [Candidatus Paceibacterota bacterium]